MSFCLEHEFSHEQGMQSISIILIKEGVLCIYRIKLWMLRFLGGIAVWWTLHSVAIFGLCIGLTDAQIIKGVCFWYFSMNMNFILFYVRFEWRLSIRFLRNKATLYIKYKLTTVMFFKNSPLFQTPPFRLTILVGHEICVRYAYTTKDEKCFIVTKYYRGGNDVYTKDVMKKQTRLVMYNQRGWS